MIPLTDMILQSNCPVSRQCEEGGARLWWLIAHSAAHSPWPDQLSCKEHGYKRTSIFGRKLYFMSLICHVASTLVTALIRGDIIKQGGQTNGLTNSLSEAFIGIDLPRLSARLLSDDCSRQWMSCWVSDQASSWGRCGGDKDLCIIKSIILSLLPPIKQIVTATLHCPDNNLMMYGVLISFLSLNILTSRDIVQHPAGLG